MANVPRHDEADHVMGGAHPAPRPFFDHVQRRLLNAGRLLLLTGGWLVLTHHTVGNDRAMNAEHALFGFALLLLGVFLVMLSPVAPRFPGATRFGTAVADAVLFYYLLVELAPAGNY
ncbi:hypothetical protein BDA96_10G294300 [Sorghum bicolor]|uniref:Uncharacterized protein n=1 Tax=Sorghum bicolor TaxID=4558 RepID=A0A921U1X6_SORBI|nr:hypothetical protein BDA96_10G294300 [Sorghum bicolor]